MPICSRAIVSKILVLMDHQVYKQSAGRWMRGVIIIERGNRKTAAVAVSRPSDCATGRWVIVTNSRANAFNEVNNERQTALARFSSAPCAWTLRHPFDFFAFMPKRGCLSRLIKP